MPQSLEGYHHGTPPPRRLPMGPASATGASMAVTATTTKADDFHLDFHRCRRKRVRAPRGGGASKRWLWRRRADAADLAAPPAPGCRHRAVRTRAEAEGGTRVCVGKTSLSARVATALRPTREREVYVGFDQKSGLTCYSVLLPPPRSTWTSVGQLGVKSTMTLCRCEG